MKTKTFEKNEGRVSGLDSIRFICALWVVFAHGLMPSINEYFDRTHLFGSIIRGLYNNIWNGQAAVIIFFVISGFCIHFPHSKQSTSINLLHFYTRRFLRVLLPMGVAIVISHFTEGNLTLFQASVLWSLLAELIYYLIYPFFIKIRSYYSSWKPLILVSVGCTVFVILTHDRPIVFPAYGPWMNWIVGLPCWLVGCELAERYKVKKVNVVSVFKIWMLRLHVLIFAWLANFLNFHLDISLPWTLNLFSVYSAYWLYFELIRQNNISENNYLEKFGKWSYSLYLMHVVIMCLFVKYIPNFNMVFGTRIAIASAILGGSCLFYYLIEKPCHRLAIKISNSFKTHC